LDFDIEFDAPEIELNVPLEVADKLQTHEEGRPAPWVVNQDSFVQSLLQRELERRRELAEQERQSRAPSRASAPSRLSSDITGYPGSESQPDSWQHAEFEAKSDERRRKSSAFEVDMLAMSNVDPQTEQEMEARMEAITHMEARVSALRRRSSFKPPEEPDPIGFVREKGVNDHLNQVDQQLRKVREKKQLNAQHMYDAMIDAGVIRLDDGPKLPRRPASSHGHGHHKSRPRPPKKENMDSANKWIEDTKPKAWLIFSEKAGWVQNRELQKQSKHVKIKMLRGLNKKGLSFGSWLSSHGREYGATPLDATFKMDPLETDKNCTKRDSAATKDEPAKDTRTSMAMNDGSGMMYSGVACARGSDKQTNTGRFWRPTVPVNGLQAPSNFHTM
jgi:hypothetical protein